MKSSDHPNCSIVEEACCHLESNKRPLINADVKNPQKKKIIIIQTDHLISARRFYLIIINKKKKNRTFKIVDFAVPVDHRIKLIECEKDKYLDLARELKKLWNMKVTIVPIVIGAFGTATKGLLKSLEDLEVGRRAKTQTPVKNHQLTLMWKTVKEYNNNNNNNNIRHSTPETTLKDYMYLKREKGDLPASKTLLTHWYNDSKTT